MGVTLISIYWPRIGGGLNAIFVLIVAWFFQAFTKSVRFLLTLCELFPADYGLLSLLFPLCPLNLLI